MCKDEPCIECPPCEHCILNKNTWSILNKNTFQPRIDRYYIPYFLDLYGNNVYYPDIKQQ